MQMQSDPVTHPNDVSVQPQLVRDYLSISVIHLWADIPLDPGGWEARREERMRREICECYHPTFPRMAPIRPCAEVSEAVKAYIITIIPNEASSPFPSSDDAHVGPPIALDLATHPDRVDHIRCG